MRSLVFLALAGCVTEELSTVPLHELDAAITARSGDTAERPEDEVRNAEQSALINPLRSALALCVPH